MPSVAAALVAETVPGRYRQTFIAWLLIGIPLGGFLGGLVGAWCLPHYGWRAVYLIGGGATAAVLLACAVLLPESNRFLALCPGRERQLARLMARIEPRRAFAVTDHFVLLPHEEHRSSVAGLFSDGRARMTLLFWLGAFVNLLTFYFVVNWTPTLFREAGLTAGAATLSTSAVNAGGMLCGLVLGPFCNRIGTRDAAIATFSLAAAGLLLISVFDGSLVPMMLGAFLAGAGAIGGASALTMFGAESYPTVLRSTGIGWALSAGRIGSIISPWLVAVPLGWNWHAEAIVPLPILPIAIGALAIGFSRGRQPVLTSVSPPAKVTA